MKYYLFISILLCFISNVFASVKVKISDSFSGEPLAGVTVIASNGLIKGISDKNGDISVADSDFPLTLRSLGYEPLALPTPVSEALMTPASYSLPDITVAPGERPISRVVCFAREYSTGVSGKDTMQLYSEYMLEAFVADEKAKGFKKGDNKPKIRSQRSFFRNTDGMGPDSVTTYGRENDQMMLSLVETVANLPTDNMVESDAIRNGDSTDTIPGKYFPKTIISKSDKMIVKRSDRLADHEGHAWSPWFFKLLGMTMDLKRIDTSAAYLTNERGMYGLEDLLFVTYNLNAMVRGKWLKFLLHTDKEVELDSYVEIYPVDITRLTIPEYKEARKDEEELEFSLPAGLQPMSPATQILVDRASR